MEDKEIISLMVSGVVKNPQIWDAALTNMLRELSKYKKEERDHIIKEIMTGAVRELSDADYTVFLRKVADSLIGLDEDTRTAILTSNVIVPEGLMEGEMKKVTNAMASILKDIVLNGDADTEEVIRIVLKTFPNMPEDDLVDVMKSLSGTSLTFKSLDYLVYTSTWLNVVGEMPVEDIRKILRARNEAIASFPKELQHKGETLTKLALLFVNWKKRKNILEALKGS